MNQVSIQPTVSAELTWVFPMDRLDLPFFNLSSILVTQISDLKPLTCELIIAGEGNYFPMKTARNIAYGIAVVIILLIGGSVAFLAERCAWFIFTGEPQVLVAMTLFIVTLILGCLMLDTVDEFIRDLDRNLELN